MFQQSILDALSNMNFTPMSWQGLSDLGSEQIASTFSDHYGLEGVEMPSGMFQSITPEMLQGASYSTYSPQIQAKGQSMLPDLYKNLGGRAATMAAGGFSGSGGFKQQQQGVKDVYGKSMVDVLSGVRGQQSQGIGAISDLISQWHNAAQSIKGLG